MRQLATLIRMSRERAINILFIVVLGATYAHAGAEPRDARQPTTSPLKPKAYVICIGVKDNDSPDWNLQFAADDARQMRRAVESRLTAAGYDVAAVTLVSDGPEKFATRKTIRAALQLLAGAGAREESEEQRQAREAPLRAELPREGGGLSQGRLEQATPDDLVLVFFSGHGYAHESGEFYLIPSDIGPEHQLGERPEPDMLKKYISGEDLSRWFRRIDADEMVLIIDACHSAASVAAPWFKPAPLGGRGLGQLAYDKRMRVLAASQADQVALEVGGAVRQGLLTYALVRDGLEKGRAAKGEQGTITLGSWLGYAVERVPELYREAWAGDVKGPQREADADVHGVFVAKDGRRRRTNPTSRPAQGPYGVQTPQLFDYRRRGEGDLLLAKPD